MDKKNLVKGKTYYCHGKPFVYTGEKVDKKVKCTNTDGKIAYLIEGELKEMPNKTQQLIAETCDELKEFLIEKNKAYGDSALNPVRIFSSASPEEQIDVRIDDKLSRLSRGSAAGEDVIEDLLGYLVLKKVYKKMEKY